MAADEPPRPSASGVARLDANEATIRAICRHCIGHRQANNEAALAALAARVFIKTCDARLLILTDSDSIRES